MCNFVPRECVAFGRLHEMQQLVPDWIIPGIIQAVPLLYEDITYQNPEPFRGYGFLHVTNIPDGLEVLAVSKLSAALSPLIGRHEAVVELNLRLSFGGEEPSHQEPFSPCTQRLVSRLRVSAEQARPSASATVAVLDSGVDPGSLRLCEQNDPPPRSMVVRKLAAFDYSNEASPQVADPKQIADLICHGALVCRILDAVLPPQVSLAVGRVARRRTDVITTLFLARSYAHIVASVVPTVVNLSLVPRQHFVFCSYCGKEVLIDSFQTLILPRVFQLADRTWTVMAAGNTGRPCNPDHFLADCKRLIFATALDSSNRPAGYSSYVEGSKARSLAAFGGDPEIADRGQGVLTGSVRVTGTSFAAPFVSAGLWAAAHQGLPEDLVIEHCRSLLADAHQN